MHRLGILMALALAAANAFADGNSGTLTQKREIVSMTAVYAGMTLSEMGSGVVVFTDIPDAIDHLPADLDKEPDSVETAIAEQGAKVVTLKILRSLTPMLWVCGEGDCAKQTVFDEKALKLVLTRYDDQRIEGTIKGSDKRSGMAVDLAFALDLHNVAEATERNGPNYAHETIGKAMLPAPEKPAAQSAVYSDGKAIGLADSYAFAAQDEFNHDPRNRGRAVLVFTDGKMDKAALAKAENVLRAVNDQYDSDKFKHILILRLLAGGKVFVDLRGDEPRYAAMGDDTQLLKLRRNDGKRVEGSYLCKDQNEKRLEGHLCFDLQFAQDVVHGK